MHIAIEGTWLEVTTVSSSGYAWTGGKAAPSHQQEWSC